MILISISEKKLFVFNTSKCIFCLCFGIHFRGFQGDFNARCSGIMETRSRPSTIPSKKCRWNDNVQLFSVCVLVQGVSSMFQTDLFPGEIEALAERSSCSCKPTSLVPTEAGQSDLELTTCHAWLKWEALGHWQCTVFKDLCFVQL